MINIPLNADVECSDGPGGQSISVIVEPANHQVTNFVVKEKKHPHTERLVPVDKVIETTSDLIRLNCTRTELAELDAFIVTEFRQVEIPRYVGAEFGPSPFYSPQFETLSVGRERVLKGELAVRQGAKVEATDGEVGRVDELLADSTTGVLGIKSPERGGR